MEKLKLPRNKEYILGIHFETHDTGAAIVDSDGKIVAAVNEERLSRIKMDVAPPLKAIACLLEMTDLKPEDFSYVVFSGKDNSLKKKIQYLHHNLTLLNWRTLPKKLASKAGRDKIVSTTTYSGILPFEKRKKQILEALKGFRGPIVFVDHHFAHAASAYYSAGVKDALIVTIDGEGDGLTSRICIGEDGHLREWGATKWPHSVGQFYQLVTVMLGFNARRHGGKITGLAAFGDPKKCAHLVNPLLKVKSGTNFWVNPKVYELKKEYSATKTLPKYFQGFSREHLAAAFQHRLEEVASTLVKNAVDATGVRNVLLAGGVCANVKMNQRIRDLPNVDYVFVSPGMSDCGIAVGAALYGWSLFYPVKQVPKIPNVYFGPSFSEKEIEDECKKQKVKYFKVKNYEKYVAELIHKKVIVGRFDGRMEYGPRALGHRTIMAFATDATINDWLNARMKRSEFMPFAPVTLEEEAPKGYKDYDKSHHAAQFMTITYDVLPKWKKMTPAVTHVDGTARPQIINPEIDLHYYKILKEYNKISGLPCCINTSFNMHEEPIVCSPYDAIRSMKINCVDVISAGPFIITDKFKLPK